jgi:hypothetical protein
MIIEHRKRMTTDVPNREVALEIHLRQIVRRVMLETPARLMLGRFQRIDHPVATKDPVDGARCRNPDVTLVLKTALQLTGTPRRMTIPQFDHETLD